MNDQPENPGSAQETEDVRMSAVMIEEVAEFFKVLSEPLRLGVLLELRNREMTVGEIASFAGTSTANVSKHLMMMRKAGFLQRRKEGNQVHYSLSSKNVLQICNFICRDIRSRLEHKRSVLSEEEHVYRPGVESKPS
jgi:DNA-binding transcriptional ArsR family regulator